MPDVRSAERCSDHVGDADGGDGNEGGRRADVPRRMLHHRGRSCLALPCVWRRHLAVVTHRPRALPTACRRPRPCAGVRGRSLELARSAGLAALTVWRASVSSPPPPRGRRAARGPRHRRYVRGPLRRRSPPRPAGRTTRAEVPPRGKLGARGRRNPPTRSKLSLAPHLRERSLGQ